MFITALFTIARTQKQPRCPLTDEWINKLWYIYTVGYYSVIKWNAFDSVLKRWMNLDPNIQSYMESRKMVVIILQGSNGDRDIESRLGSQGREAEGGANWASSIETYTWPCVEHIANGNFPYDTGNSNLVLCDKWEQQNGEGVGGRFKREGVYVYLWLIHLDARQRPIQYCKSMILLLKINKLNKNENERKERKKTEFQNFRTFHICVFGTLNLSIISASIFPR